MEGDRGLGKTDISVPLDPDFSALPVKLHDPSSKKIGQKKIMLKWAGFS